MKTTININGKDVEITLTKEQVAKIKKSTLSIHERIDQDEDISFEDILEDQKITEEQFAEMIKNDTEDEAAFKRVKLIAKCFNKTVLLDNETWYIPIFYKSGSGFSRTHSIDWTTCTDVGSRLCGFRSKAHSDYAGKKLGHIYKPLL